MLLVRSVPSSFEDERSSHLPLFVPLVDNFDDSGDLPFWKRVLGWPPVKEAHRRLQRGHKVRPFRLPQVKPFRVLYVAPLEPSVHFF